MGSDIGAYVFVCSAGTEPECYRRQLLGTNDPGEVVLGIQPGDTLFLYNYTRKTLRGPFQATSAGSRDLVLEAWGGSFPFQVRFAVPPDGIREIGKKAIEPFIPFATPGMPYLAISVKAKEQLLGVLLANGKRVEAPKAG
jgi:hypothetical protein